MVTGETVTNFSRVISSTLANGLPAPKTGPLFLLGTLLHKDPGLVGTVRAPTVSPLAPLTTPAILEDAARVSPSSGIKKRPDDFVGPSLERPND